MKFAVMKFGKTMIYFVLKKPLKYHNGNCSTKHTDLVGAEPGIVHKNAGYLP